MADIVNLITNPGGNTSGLVGNLIGRGTGIAQRATSNIPGANQALAGLGQIAQDLFQSKPNFAGVYGSFLTNILQSFANSPTIMPLWVCYISLANDNELDNADLLDQHGLGSHSIISQRNAVKGKWSQQINDQIGSALAVMFCQGVKTPEDTFQITRDSYSNPIGGFLPGFTGNSRNINECTISFIENNSSFVDFYLRPWLIYNSYVGVPSSLKATITIEQYVRTLPPEGPNKVESIVDDITSPFKNFAQNTGLAAGPAAAAVNLLGTLKRKKKFTLINARPSSIDNEQLTYKDTSDARQIQFIYDAYKLEGETGWDTEQAGKKDASLLSKIGDIALNTAGSLVNRQIEKFESNLFSIRAQTVPLGANNRVEDGQSITTQPKKVFIKPGNIDDVPEIRRIESQPVATQLKESVPEVFEIISNRLQKVITPENDAINIEELERLAQEGIKNPPTDDAFLDAPTQTPHIKRTPSTPDTPVYPPYGRANPTKIVNKEDVPSINSVPVQIKPISKSDVSNGRISAQPVAIPTDDVP